MIQVGDTLPTGTVKIKYSDSISDLSTGDIFDNKKVILFGVPGAFTPTCSGQHLPSFLQHYSEFQAKGVDTIACISVNDAHVMDAWKNNLNVGNQITMIADGSADYVRLLGLDQDLSSYGMGIRAKRFSMYVDNGVVKFLHVENFGECSISEAPQLLSEI